MPVTYDLILKGGTVVNHDGEGVRDIGVRAGRFAALGELSRAFAAVALGGVADKEMLPWNSKIGVNMNYRAAVETLTNSRTGILDIL